MPMRPGTFAIAVALLGTACGTSRLFAAVDSGDVHEVERELATGAKVDARDRRGATPLGHAASKGSREIAELLIARGADVNARTAAGLTPLHAAAYWGEGEVAELLLSRGADANAGSTGGWTPLHKAVERLSDPARARCGDSPGDPETARAARIVELLLASGADPNAHAASGDTPLIMAAASGRKTLVEALLERGAAVDGRGPEGVTPLYAAAFPGCVDVVEALIARGAEVDARTKSGYTPLTYAARAGDAALASSLLAHRAAVDATDQTGRTPLVWALSLAALASPSGQSLLRRQAGAGELEAVRKGLGRAKGQWAEVARRLVEHGADVRASDRAGASPLYLAAVLGEAALVVSLLDRGAILDDPRTGETPLHAAVAEGHRDVAALLVERGASVRVTNLSGRTPLHFVATFSDDPALAEAMIARGAQPGAKDEDGRIALDYAIRAGNRRVAEVLRAHAASPRP
jgi:ankyrin repeat protein